MQCRTAENYNINSEIKTNKKISTKQQYLGVFESRSEHSLYDFFKFNAFDVFL